MKPKISISKIADIILVNATVNGKQLHNLMHGEERKGLEHGYLLVLEDLETDGLIDIFENVPGKPLYKLTRKGFELKESGKGYQNYLDDEAEKKRKQTEREERDEQIKIYQYEDLKRKVTEINDEQLKFWRRQRWQFWLTLMVAGAAFILSTINFVKSLIIN